MKPSIQTLIKRYGMRCHYCENAVVLAKGSNDSRLNVATREHIVPRSFGGSWASHNIILACRGCNEKRANDYFYCGCTVCLNAYDLVANDLFLSLMKFNETKIRKTKRRNWQLVWHSQQFYYDSWSEAIDNLYIKEMNYYAASQNR